MKKKIIEFGLESKKVNLYDLSESDLIKELERYIRLSLKDTKLYLGCSVHIEWLDEWRNEAKNKNSP